MQRDLKDISSGPIRL